MSEQESAAPEAAEEAKPEPKNLCQWLSDGQAVKYRTVRQRACDEPKPPRGKKICAGHLKRWYGFGPAVTDAFGPNPEIYRCERCQMLYRPNDGEVARTGTLAF